MSTESKDCRRIVQRQRLLQRRGLLDDSCVVLRKGIERFPRNDWLYVHLAATLQKKGDLQGAIADPFLTGMSALCTALYETKDYNAAWEEVKKLRMSPHAPPPEILAKLVRDSGRQE